MKDIKKRHDVSEILAQLASEKRADPSPGPASTADTDSVSEKSVEVLIISNARARTSSVEAPSNMHLPQSFGNIEEVPQNPILSQFHDARKPLAEIPITADSHGIVGANSPPSQGYTILAQTPRPYKRAWASNIKKWFGKWGPPHTKK